MEISLIIPSRNNLKYLEWAYDSIRKAQRNHEVEICVADDFSSDGTKEWCESVSKIDKLDNLVQLADIVDVSGALETNKVKDINKIKKFTNKIKIINDAN